MRAPRCDFWQVGIARQPVTAWAETGGPAAAANAGIQWLPDPGPWRYLADPFGVRRGELIHVFVEAFDYRSKHAVIERHELGADLSWRGSEVALRRPFHLSYPFLIEEQGEVFMIPESHRAGEIALYRADRFPRGWRKETVLLSNVAGAEPSVIRHEGRWWMFFTVVGPAARDQRELHVAHAGRLEGPWTLHPLNPVLQDRTGARPGGTPFIDATGSVVLPVQDCSRTYGGALRFARFTELSPASVKLSHLPARVEGSMVSATHQEGCHTLAGCGDLTLFDVKRVVRSHAKRWLDLRRHLSDLLS